MKTIIRFTISVLVLLLTAYLLPGVTIDTFSTAIIIALTLVVINIFVKPFIILLTLPITIFTMGLFLIIINTLCLLLASHIVDGFIINGFWWAFLFSIIYSIIGSFLTSTKQS